MAEGKGMQEGDNISASGLGPFRYSLYRTLLISVLFSYICAAMYDIGSSWLMVSLTPNPLLVSLITKATTPPIFLFALPFGTISDIFDMRNILFIACAYMSIVSTILGILALLGLITPTVLLILTFAHGAGTTGGKRYKTTSIDDLDFTHAGSDYWSIPHQLSVNPPKSDGQALITIEYRIDPK